MKKTSPTLTRIADIFSDGEYHDGTTVGNQLNISRNAVCKTIKKLKDYGINITSKKNKGYRLHEPLNMLSQSKITQGLSDKNTEVLVIESVDSTNTYLKSFYNTAGNKVCLAEHQSHGKGRLNRSWHAPFAQNIYLSYLCRFQKDISELAGLSLIVSLAILRTIEKLNLPTPPKVKWPNDIVCNGQKLVGILIELQAEANGTCQVITGVGINVNMMTDAKHEITQEWTSLRKILGRYLDRNELCSSLLNNLAAYVKRFEISGLSVFMEEWEQADYLHGQHISLKCLDKNITGVMEGINQQGNLLLRLSDGSMQTFSSGDTSIVSHRGLKNTQKY